MEDTSINQNIPQNTPKKRNDRTSKVETFGKRSKFPNSPKCLEVDIFRILAVKWSGRLHGFVSHFTRFSRHTLNRTLTSKDVLGEYPLPCVCWSMTLFQILKETQKRYSTNKRDKLESPTLSEFPTRVCQEFLQPHCPIKPMLLVPSTDRSNARFMPAMKKKEEKESFCSFFKFCHPLRSSNSEALFDTFDALVRGRQEGQEGQERRQGQKGQERQEGGGDALDFRGFRSFTSCHE